MQKQPSEASLSFYMPLLLADGKGVHDSDVTVKEIAFKLIEENVRDPERLILLLHDSEFAVQLFARNRI